MSLFCVKNTKLWYYSCGKLNRTVSVRDSLMTAGAERLNILPRRMKKVKPMF